MNIPKIALTLYAAAVLTLLSTPSMALEAHVLSTHGDWTVQLELTEENDMLCAAVVDNRLGESFDITLYENGHIGVYYWFDNSVEQFADQDLKVLIHNSKEWTLPEMLMSHQGGFFLFSTVMQSMQFAADIQKGSSLSVTRSSSHSASGKFSLKGSHVAMQELYNCFRLIQGTAS